MPGDNPRVTGPLSPLSQICEWHVLYWHVTRVTPCTWPMGTSGRCHVTANIQLRYFLGNMKHIHQSYLFINSSRRRRLIRQRSVVKMNQESGNLGCAPDEWPGPDICGGAKKQQPWSQARCVNPGPIRADNRAPAPGIMNIPALIPRLVNPRTRPSNSPVWSRNSPFSGN